MCVFDANQFRQTIKEGDVSGRQVAAGHQVVEDAADVDHHLAGGLLLVSVSRELGHQDVHHFCGCTKQIRIVRMMFTIHTMEWKTASPNRNASSYL